MQWFYNLFIRPEIYAFAQNYKDDPSRWKYSLSARRFTNERDNLLIEFNSDFRGVYEFTGRQIQHKNDLRFFERRKLITTFRQFATYSTAPIPTKATHPEEFI